MRRVLLHACLISSLASVGQLASAQVTYAIQPLVGYYQPLGHFDPAAFYSTDLPRTPSDLAGLLWGGSAQVTFAGRLGIEGAVSTAASTIRGCPCPGGFVLPPTPARVTVATVAGQYDLSNRPARYRLSANVGPALMRHGGAAYGRYGSPTSWGGTAGLELAASIAKHLHVVATVSGVGYSFNLASPPEHGPQLDATALLGVRWHSGP